VNYISIIMKNGLVKVRIISKIPGPAENPSIAGTQLNIYNVKPLFFKIRLLCFTGLLLLCVSKMAAQQGTNYSVNANIIYHFTKYINWPSDKKSGDFIIGIVGDTPLYDELKSITANKSAGSQKIVIMKYRASAHIFNCHILFISEDESGNLKKIVLATTGTSTLLVTESEGLARRGSCINFIIADEHLKIEINKNNIEQRNLSIANELLQLGILVK
jgi:YfiR/HmsC-like